MKIYTQSLMLNVQQLPSATDIQEDMMYLQESDTCHKTKKNTTPRTSEDSVIYNSIITTQFIVEHPEMKPQRDYQDYTKFANEEFSN